MPYSAELVIPRGNERGRNPGAVRASIPVETPDTMQFVPRWLGHCIAKALDIDLPFDLIALYRRTDAQAAQQLAEFRATAWSPTPDEWAGARTAKPHLWRALMKARHTL